MFLYSPLASEFVYVPHRSVEAASRKAEIIQFAGALYALTRVSIPCSRTLADIYPDIRFDFVDIYNEVIRFAGESLTAADQADVLFKMALLSDDSDRCLVYLQLFGAMISHSPKAVTDFLSLFDEMRRKYPWNVLETWLKRGADLMSSNRVEEGVNHLLVQNRESRSLLGITAGVLADIKGMLQIYCGSIGDSTFGIQSLSISTFGISEPYTDGKTIFLPARVDTFPTIAENEAMYTAIAALQAAHVRAGTFSFHHGNLDFQTEIRQRYGTALPDQMEHVRKQYGETAEVIRERPSGDVEVVFAGDRTMTVLLTPHEEYFYQFPTPDLFRELFTFLESYRVEAMLRLKYPGLRDDFENINRKIASKIPKRKFSQDLGDQLPYVLDRLFALSIGIIDRGEMIEGRLGELFDNYQEILRRLAGADTTVNDAAYSAFSIYNMLYDSYPIIPWCRLNDIRAIFEPARKSNLYPEIVLDVSPELITGLKEKPVFETEEEGEAQEIDLTTVSQAVRKARSMREAILSGRIRVYGYPEYDCHRGSLLQKHCILYESFLEGDDMDLYPQTLKRYQRVYKQLKKRFLMMQPEELEISRRWEQGDEMHLSDAVDYCTDILRGESSDDKIFVRRRRNVRDIAAAIVLDSSSSTEETVGAESILFIEKTALCLLAGVLAPIGDTFGIFSYFSMGRHNVFYMTAKDFDEPWNESTQSRISSIQAAASNRDGCIIRHTTARLLERPEKTKLLILLSDGTPADSDYGSKDASETNEYAIEDTRRAIIDARLRGIIPYCITIDRRAKSYVPHLYGDYHYTVLSDVATLPEKLSRLYLRLTG